MGWGMSAGSGDGPGLCRVHVTQPELRGWAGARGQGEQSAFLLSVPNEAGHYLLNTSGQTRITCETFTSNTA